MPPAKTGTIKERIAKIMTSSDIVSQLTVLQKNASPDEAKHLYENLITLITGKQSNKMSPVVKFVQRKKPERILDIGCGYGALAIFFAMQGPEVAGIDLNQEALDAGKRLTEILGISNLTFTAMDACSISLSDFDIALSTDFYEHLPYDSQQEHLLTVWKALKPGGTYMIRAPHRSNIRQHRTGHIGLPSFKKLKQQANDAGYSVRFSIAHTSLISPVNYHIPVEQWIEARNWSDLTIYKGLQKCGLANVIAYLKKV